MLPTKAFLAPMDEDEEIEVGLAKGNTVVIKYKALSELQPTGNRCARLRRLQNPKPAACMPLSAFWARLGAALGEHARLRCMGANHAAAGRHGRRASLGRSQAPEQRRVGKQGQ